MDYANERYVRLYTRDTTTVKLLGWQGRLVWWSLLRKLDRSGVIDCEGIEPWEVAALHCDVPEDVAREGMRRCLERGCLVVQAGRVVAPNYLDANETPQSDKQRARESRERRAALDRDTDPDRDSSRNNRNNDTREPVTIRDHESQNVTLPSQNVMPASRAVTPRHAPSRNVTPSVPSLPCRAVPSDPSVPSQTKTDCEGVALTRLPRRKQAPPRDPTGLQIATAAAWDAYRVAYRQRYDAEPVRNAKVNGQIRQLCARLAHDEIPHVVAAYLRSNNARYVASGHAVGPLLQDAEAVRTEAVTGRQRTQWGARDADKRDGRGAAYQEMFDRLSREDAEKAKALNATGE